MSEDEQAAEWAVEWISAGILAAAAGWCAGQVVGPLAALAAAAGAVVLAVALFRLTAGDSAFPLPAFALPPFPEAPPEELLLTQRTDGVVVPLRPRPSLPTPGELDRRIRAHLDGRPRMAEVVALEADASAALREALAKLKQVRG